MTDRYSCSAGERRILDRLATITSYPDLNWVTCGDGHNEASIVTPSARSVVLWIRGGDA